MKKFTNPKAALNYLKNKAKEGEEIILDERANAIYSRRVHYFKKPVIIRNSLGWENEFGEQLAYDKEHSFMNICRNPKFQRPIWKDKNKK